MKAVIVSKAFVSGMYRKKLAELASLGLEVVGVTPSEWREGGVQRLEYSAHHGYELVETPLRWNGHFHVHYYPQLPSILQRVRPDLLHMDEEPYNFATYLGLRTANRLRLPSVFFSWQNIHRRYPPPFRQIEQSVYRHAALGLAGSEQARHVLIEKGFRRPIVVIPQFGVDPDVFAPRSRRYGPFTVGFLNRLIPAKAPMLTVRAFGMLPHDARLLVVGEGPLQDELAAEVQRLGLQARVVIRGRVPSAEVPSLMSGLDVVVLPSLTTPSWKEQFGRVLIEAMSSGVTVVGSDSGEIPNVIGDAGIVVPEGDEYALAQALERLYRDESLRKKLAEKGRARAINLFSHRHIAEQTLAAYELALTQ